MTRYVLIAEESSSVKIERELLNLESENLSLEIFRTQSEHIKAFIIYLATMAS